MQWTYHIRHDARKGDQINEEAAIYPNIYLFLLMLKPMVTNNKYLWERFKFWSNLSEEKALECLTYGTMPILRLFDDSTSNGDFVPSQPDYVNVNWRFANALQNGGSEASVKALEALVLHELVHWGRKETKTPDPYYNVVGPFMEINGTGDMVWVKKPGQLDSGERFKWDAYINPDKPHLGYRTEPYVFG